MQVTARRLNRATLARQLLSRREVLPVPEAVRRIVAIQAQEQASPSVALWNRVTDLSQVDVHRAFASHEVVKAQLLRITLHAVHAGDYPALQHAMVGSLRGSCLRDPRFTETGLSVADADALVADLLVFAATPCTNADIEAWLETRFGRPVPRVWWALRRFVPVVHAATGDEWAHGPRPAYVVAPTRPPAGDPAASVQWLVRRYLEGFGPASAHDIAQFSILRMPVVRPALEALGDSLVTLEGPDGRVLYDVPGMTLPKENAAAPPRLMAMWDSSLLAYADRDRIIPADYRPLVIRLRNGDVLPTLLVDGYVAGVWRTVEGGIEATAFHELPPSAWQGLASEARSLLAFLGDRAPRLYRRYTRWWDTLPKAEIRVLSQ